MVQRRIEFDPRTDSHASMRLWERILTLLSRWAKYSTRRNAKGWQLISKQNSESGAVRWCG